jgi:hypothetical protein
MVVQLYRCDVQPCYAKENEESTYFQRSFE